MFITKGIDADCFEEMLAGKKFYELRLGNFLGRREDTLVLEEKGENGRRTGRRILSEITYVLAFALGDLPWTREEVDRFGFALMSVEKIEGEAELPEISLKTWPREYWKVWREEKRFEFRLADREYLPGAVLSLGEWWPKCGAYSGRSFRVRVTQSRRWTLPELARFWPLEEIERHGLAVISLRPISPA